MYEIRHVYMKYDRVSTNFIWFEKIVVKTYAATVGWQPQAHRIYVRGLAPPCVWTDLGANLRVAVRDVLTSSKALLLK